MISLIKSLPCSVCCIEQRHDGWFVVAENRWFDRLRVYRWNAALAARNGYLSVCCREHLKILISCWIDQDRFRALFYGGKPTPIAGNPACDDRDSEAQSRSLVGELFIHREPFSREWPGSPEALETIVDALVPNGAEEPDATRLYRWPRLQPSRFGLSSP